MSESVNQDIIDLKIIDELRSLQSEGQPDLLMALIKLFNETTIESANQIKTAVSSRDLQSLSDAAHSLKSSAANLGALKLAKICLDLEKLDRATTSSDQLLALYNSFATEYDLAIKELNKIQPSGT